MSERYERTSERTSEWPGISYTFYPLCTLVNQSERAQIVIATKIESIEEEEKEEEKEGEEEEEEEEEGRCIRDCST